MVTDIQRLGLELGINPGALMGDLDCFVSCGSGYLSFDSQGFPTVSDCGKQSLDHLADEY
jgi:hypothetical protein